MTQCYITLDSLVERNKNPHMKDSAAVKMFGSSAVSAHLSVSRQELFAEGVRFTKGMSISGVQQKLSLRLCC